MEKKLSDYLHYYLYGKIWEVGVSTCTLIGIGDCYYTIKTKQGTLLTLSNRANIKLVLRRLEDISDEEWCEIEYATSMMEEAKGHGLSKYSFLKGGRQDRYHWTITNELLIELRKRIVDVDGLIDAGLALDAKTIKS